MLYTPLNSTDKQQFELSLLETNTSWGLFSGSGMWPLHTLHTFKFCNIFIVEVHFEPRPAPFSASYDISNDLAWNDFTSFPAPFELSNDVDFTDFSALGKAKRSHDTVFEHSATFGALNRLPCNRNST